ncbi:MAG: hypothetical protein GJ680_00360 [Alteromonadaceae bacterium]|nr:hypothetical protein [Alteromonadaceae bacterium]
MKFLLITILSLFISFFASAKSVTIDINGMKLTYDKAPRLSSVLKQAVKQGDWYWPSSKLFDNKTTEIESERQEIISELKLLLSDSSERQTQVITDLLTQVESWQLMRRISMRIDYDLARIKEQFNPRLIESHYLLRVAARPEIVNVFGTSHALAEMPHLPGAHISVYLQDDDLDCHADSDYVYVITPYGKVDKVNRSYWSNERYELAPGAEVYLPLPESLFSSEVESLNQRIVSLAMHRVK